MAHHGHISPSAREAAEALRAEGWQIMVATGRVLAATRGLARELGARGPAIVYDGARIMDTEDASVYRQWESERSAVQEALRFVWRNNLILQVYGDEQVYCRPGDVRTRRFFEGTGMSVNAVLDTPDLPGGRIFRMICFGEPQEICTLEEEVRHELAGRLSVMRAGSRFLDILPLGVSKGAALQTVREQLVPAGLPVVAVGDHMNDFAMLEHADVAVATDDAPPTLRSVADLVIPSAGDGGFEQLVRRIMDGDVVRTDEGAI